MWPPSIKLKMLVAIAILPLLLSINTKQTWAQELPAPEPANEIPPEPAKAATAMTYGLGGYTMDDKEQVMVPEYALLLNTAEDVKNYKAKNADNPCMMELNKDNKFQLVYDEDAAKHGCTVDLVIGTSEEALRAKMVVTDPMSCLEDCAVNTFENELAASSANLFPFTYSQSNEEFKKLHNGPPYNEDQPCKSTCPKKGGECMNTATSLQLAWNKCTTNVKAMILLVGEPNSAWSMEQEAKDTEATIDLIIAMGNNPTVTMQKDGKQTVFPIGPEGKPESPSCFTDDKLALIPELKFWTIKSGNTQLNSKHLVVFHFLPQTATRIFDKEGKLQNPPGPEMPKCKGKLYIAFENVAGLLQSMPEPTTTIQTTTTTVETTSTTSDEATSDMPETTSEMPMTATNETETNDAPSNEISTLLIVGIVAGAVVLWLLVAVLVYCLCCRDKDSEEDSEEDVEDGVIWPDDDEDDEDDSK